MARDIYNDTIIDTDPTTHVAKVLTAGVFVHVTKTSDDTDATLYVDRTGGVEIANPFEAIDGIVRFWADGGEYDVSYHDTLSRIGDSSTGWEALSAAPDSLDGEILADGTITVEKLASSVARFLMPVGVILPYGGATAPTGFLLADGSAKSRTTYAALFALFGTAFGVGDGSTTFNLPNMQVNMPIGVGTRASHTLARGDAGGFFNHQHAVPNPIGGRSGGSLFIFQEDFSSSDPFTTAPADAYKIDTSVVGLDGTGAIANIHKMISGAADPPYVALNYIIRDGT